DNVLDRVDVRQWRAADRPRKRLATDSESDDRMASSPAVAFDYASAPRGALSTTERNFWRAVVLTIGVVAVFWTGYVLERYVFHHGPHNARFVPEATEAAMRYITIPHIIIGFLFMVSSRNNQTTVKRLWIVGLVVVGAFLSTLYGLAGGKTNQLFYASIF